MREKFAAYAASGGELPEAASLRRCAPGMRDGGELSNQGSEIRYQVSGIRYQVSGIRYQVSGESIRNAAWP